MTEICYKNEVLSKKFTSNLSASIRKQKNKMDKMERWKEAVAKAVVDRPPQICFTHIPVFLMPLLSGREKKTKQTEIH